MTVRVRSELVSFWCICSSVHQGSWLNCCHTAEMTVLTSDACTAGFHWFFWNTFFFFNYTLHTFLLLSSTLSSPIVQTVVLLLRFSTLCCTLLLFFPSSSLLHSFVRWCFWNLYSFEAYSATQFQNDRKTLLYCVFLMSLQPALLSEVLVSITTSYGCDESTFPAAETQRGFRDTGTEWFLGLNIVPLMWTWENYSAYWLIIVFDALKILRIFCCGSIQLRDHCITMCCKTELLVFVTNSKWSYSVLFCQDLEKNEQLKPWRPDVRPVDQKNESSGRLTD